MKKLLMLLALVACTEPPTAPVVEQIDLKSSNTTIMPMPPGAPYDLTSPEWRIAFGHSWWTNSGSLVECHWTGSLRIQQPNGRDFTGSIVHVGASCFDSSIGFVTPPSTPLAITNGRVTTIIGGITMVMFDLQIGSLSKCTVNLYPKSILVAHGEDCQTRPLVLYR